MMTEEKREEIYQEAKALYFHRTNTQDVYEAQTRFRELGSYKQAVSFVEKCGMLLQFSVGETVAFGHSGTKALRWKVIDERGKLRLLLAQDFVAYRAYNDTLTDTSWKTSSVRAWLNGVFLKESFTAVERMMIAGNITKTEHNADYYTNAGADALDKVFLPSKAEIERYFPNQSDRKMGTWWWLRDPGCNLLSAMSVYNDGSIYSTGIHVIYGEGGVRPALWVLLGI